MSAELMMWLGRLDSAHLRGDIEQIAAARNALDDFAEVRAGRAALARRLFDLSGENMDVIATPTGFRAYGSELACLRVFRAYACHPYLGGDITERVCIRNVRGAWWVDVREH